MSTLAIRRCLAIAAAAILLGSPSAAAQDHSQGELIERFLNLATTELDLSVEQRQQLTQILHEAAEHRRQLGRQQAELGRAIRDALSSPGTDQATFQRLLDQRLQLQREGLALQGSQQERVATVLTPRQTLRFMMMQERLARRIEAMQRERRRDQP